tara:strand:- start:57 stop:1052 length:996 start_codon:yes stop_codon:yes gene_type:complete
MGQNNSYLLNISILSYNRTKELIRLFDSLESINRDDIIVSVYEDCSPNQEKISKICSFYKKKLNIKVDFLPAKKNIGYDKNLLRSLNCKSKFVLLLSDDDYLDASLMNDFASFLKNKNPDVVICPFVKRRNTYRSGSHYNNNYSVDVLYDSVLFSGLTFKTKKISIKENDYNFIKNSIYSQVFIVASLWTKKSYYYNNNIIIAGEDGENFFGKSEATKEMLDLLDRSEPFSNLYYQSKLQKVAFYSLKKFYPELLVSFLSNYSKRLVSQFIRIKLSTNVIGYVKAILKLKSMKLRYNKKYFIIIFCVTFIPNFFLAHIYKFIIKKFRVSGG